MYLYTFLFVETKCSLLDYGGITEVLLKKKNKQTKNV